MTDSQTRLPARPYAVLDQTATDDTAGRRPDQTADTAADWALIDALPKAVTQG